MILGEHSMTEETGNDKTFLTLLRNAAKPLQ